MRPLLHALALRITRAAAFCLGLATLFSSVLAQTNLDAEPLSTENPHELRPLPEFIKWGLWSLAAALLIILCVVLAIRHRLSTNLYKEASHDEHWKDDSEEYAAERIDKEEVDEACESLGKKPDEPAGEAPAAVAARPKVRLFTPASGPAWAESMVKAFLTTCMKVNGLGRTWRESAAWSAQSPDMPDPREAELVRRLMQRWQEFHVDPETGVFLEHATPGGKTRVCIISVVKEKRTLVEAGLNAGFVAETLGRYLRSTDLVYRRGLGEYHAPTRDELKKMTPGERESMMLITEIPDPWQAVIT